MTDQYPTPQSTDTHFNRAVRASVYVLACTVLPATGGYIAYQGYNAYYDPAAVADREIEALAIELAATNIAIQPHTANASVTTKRNNGPPNIRLDIDCPTNSAAGNTRGGSLYVELSGSGEATLEQPDEPKIEDISVEERSTMKADDVWYAEASITGSPTKKNGATGYYLNVTRSDETQHPWSLMVEYGNHQYEYPATKMKAKKSKVGDKTNNGPTRDGLSVEQLATVVDQAEQISKAIVETNGCVKAPKGF